MIILYFKNTIKLQTFSDINSAEAFLTAFLRYISFKQQDLLHVLRIDHVVHLFESIETLLLESKVSMEAILNKANYVCKDMALECIV